MKSFCLRLLWSVVLIPGLTFGQSQISNYTKSFVSHERGAYLLKNLTIVDGTGADALVNQDILVIDDMISAIGNNITAEDDVEVIDMTGKSAMPGLIMLHEHMFYPKSTPEPFYGVDQMSYSFPKLYLAAGVTTMRTAGSVMLQSDVNLRDKINNGEIPGPTIDVTTPHIDREGLGILELGHINSSEHGARMVEIYAEMGATSVKVYNFITRDDLKAIVDASHRLGLKVTGHLCSVTYEEATDLGIDNLEHGFFASSDFQEDKREDTCEPFKANKAFNSTPVDSDKIDQLIRKLVKNDVALTSTINVFEPYTGREVVPGGGVPALSENSRNKVYDRWASMQGRDSLDQARFAKEMAWEKAFYDAGGLLVAGTDPTYDGRIVAGYANMRLVELFTEMGFSIPEAIKICTLHGAKYLDIDSKTGTLEKGKKADLIILDGDISKDISVIRNIRYTFKNGIGYDSHKLFEVAEGMVGIR